MDIIEGLKERIEELEKFQNSVIDSFYHLGIFVERLDWQSLDKNHCCINLKEGKLRCGGHIKATNYSTEALPDVDNQQDICSDDYSDQF